MEKQDKIQRIVINGVTYVEGDSKTKELAEEFEGLKYVMCRTQSAGVFVGYLKERVGKEVTLLNARRIWYWEGACSLSQLAVDGTSKPRGCKFPTAVPEILLTESIEIIPITAKAKLSIDSVPIWQSSKAEERD